jgi:predicted Zn-dependent protease
LTDAALALGDAEQVNEMMAAFPEQSIEQKALQVRLVTSQIAQFARQIAQLEEERQKPSDQTVKTLENLHSQQEKLFFELIETAPDKIDVQALRAAAVYYLQNKKAEKAIALLDAYLAQKPNNSLLKMLRMRPMSRTRSPLPPRDSPRFS